MMNQWHMFNFAIEKGENKERPYILQLQPGSNWEEIYAVLDEFKSQFQQMQEQALKLEEEKKAKEAEPKVETTNA